MPAFAKEKFRRNDFAHEVLNSYGRRNMTACFVFFRKREEHSGRRQRIMGKKSARSVYVWTGR